MKKTQPVKKPIVGVVASVAIFLVVTTALNLALKWPTSVLTLVAMVAISWFIGVSIGQRVSKDRWVPILTMTILVGVLIVSTLGLGWPWRIGGGTAVAGENVWFKMSASFAYRGSADNLPIENVAIWFPYPNVDNEPIWTDYENGRAIMVWTLYYQENDNTLSAEQLGETGRPLVSYEFKGQRSENLNADIGTTPASDGPKTYAKVDKLYSREVLWIDILVRTQRENENTTTLRIYGDNRSGAGYWYPYDFNANVPLEPQGTPVDISVWAQLSRRKSEENDYSVIETFSRSMDNASVSGYWLYQS